MVLATQQQYAECISPDDHGPRHQDSVLVLPGRPHVLAASRSSLSPCTPSKTSLEELRHSPCDQGWALIKGKHWTQVQEIVCVGSLHPSRCLFLIATRLLPAHQALM